MDFENLNKIKLIAIKAIVSDDELMDRLILKGGSSLELIYKLADRSSIDLDFSMEDTFDDSALADVQSQMRTLLENAFREEDYEVFDVKLVRRPGVISPEIESFWGGYKLSFKIVSKLKYDEYEGNLEKIRRDSLIVGTANKRTFTIDISRFERCSATRELQVVRVVWTVWRLD